jgi:hypothetical protein
MNVVAGLAAFFAAMRADAAPLVWKTVDMETGLGGAGRLGITSRRLSLHTFGADPFRGEPGFRLFRGGGLSFDAAVSRLLRDHIVDPRIEMRVTDTSNAHALASGGQSRDFHFYVRGVPLCGYQIRAHTTSKGDTLIVGNAPGVRAGDDGAEEWPSLAATYSAVRGALAAANDLDDAALRVLRATRCLRVDDGRLQPVWSLSIEAAGMPYNAVADSDGAYEISPAFFDVTGKATTYALNAKDAAMKDFELPDMTGDGELVSTYLQTKIMDGTVQATNARHTYAYDPADPEFAEVSAYAHAQAHLTFFEDLGFKWYGPQPLEIRVHDLPNGQTNNALFLNSTADRPLPLILLGDGDGDVLANLATDSDVVSHELGHFVIFQYLTKTDGESKVIHEGMADFFTFAHTGDPCLAESACPAGAYSACWHETAHECLRTAEATITYGSDEWDSLIDPVYGLGHVHGQAVSGLLWDLRKSKKVPAKDVTTLGYAAVAYLGGASGFRDWLLALLLADKDQFDSAYFDAIKAAAIARGFESFITDVTTPEDGIPLPTGKSDGVLPGDAEDDDVDLASVKVKSTPFKCGVLATNSVDSGHTALALFLTGLFLPLASALGGRNLASRRGSQRS